MSLIRVGQLLPSLVCDRVAIDMLLEHAGVDQAVRHQVKGIITARIKNVKENGQSLDEIIKEES